MAHTIQFKLKTVTISNLIFRCAFNQRRWKTKIRTNDADKDKISRARPREGKGRHIFIHICNHSSKCLVTWETWNSNKSGLGQQPLSKRAAAVVDFIFIKMYISLCVSVFRCDQLPNWHTHTHNEREQTRHGQSEKGQWKKQAAKIISAICANCTHSLIYRSSCLWTPFNPLNMPIHNSVRFCFFRLVSLCFMWCLCMCAHTMCRMWLHALSIRCVPNDDTFFVISCGPIILLLSPRVIDADIPILISVDFSSLKFSRCFRRFSSFFGRFGLNNYWKFELCN